MKGDNIYGSQDSRYWGFVQGLQWYLFHFRHMKDGLIQ